MEKTFETFDATRDALQKLGGGIKSVVMLLDGLGGQELSTHHAAHSVRLAKNAQPKFLATLVMSFAQGEARFPQGFPGWETLNQQGSFAEMAQFLLVLALKRAVLRSDHASNWLVLKGLSSAEQDRLLAQVHQAKQSPGQVRPYAAWQYGM